MKRTAEMIGGMALILLAVWMLAVVLHIVRKADNAYLASRLSQQSNESFKTGYCHALNSILVADSLCIRGNTIVAHVHVPGAVK